MKDVEIEHNAARYRALSEPFENRDEANEALAAFFEDVKAARIKHGLPDVFVGVEISVFNGDELTKAIASLYMGDMVANKVVMLARLYGEARQEHEDVLGATINAGRTAARRRSGG